ncbi:MAG: PhoH family protein [Patescibacteria group bacterium]
MDNQKRNSQSRPRAQKKEPLRPIEPTGKNIILVDTNVPIDDTEAFEILRKGGNLLVIPATTTDELDGKKYDQRVGFECREAIRQMDHFQEIGDKNFIEESGMIFSKLNLNPDKPDHRIVATLNYVLYHFAKGHEPYRGYDKVKFITNDRGAKVVARRIVDKKDLVIEMYQKTRTKIDKKDLDIPSFFVPLDKVHGNWEKKFTFPSNGWSKKVPDGSPFIGYSHKKNAKKGEFVAIRRGDIFEIVNPKIESCGIHPKTKPEYNRPNWEQAASLFYLLDPFYQCIFMQGGAGSGKTLLAMAAAIEQRRKGIYPRILIYRVPAPVDPKKTLGLLPGDAGAKIGLYLRPIQQALLKILKGDKTLIKLEREEISADSKPERSEKKVRQTSQPLPVSKKTSNLEVHVDEIFEQNGIEVAVLEYVRGETIDDAFIIVDDAQNLNLHETKTMLTRVGENSKIVFTGDLAQIDSHYLDKYSSGLAHAIKDLADKSTKIAAVTLVQTLRGFIASLAEKYL